MNALASVKKLYNRYIELYDAIGGAILLAKSLFYHYQWKFLNRRIVI